MKNKIYIMYLKVRIAYLTILLQLYSIKERGNKNER